MEYLGRSFSKTDGGIHIRGGDEGGVQQGGRANNKPRGDLVMSLDGKEQKDWPERGTDLSGTEVSYSFPGKGVGI